MYLLFLKSILSPSIVISNDIFQTTLVTRPKCLVFTTSNPKSPVQCNHTAENLYASFSVFDFVVPAHFFVAAAPETRSQQIWSCSKCCSWLWDLAWSPWTEAESSAWNARSSPNCLEAAESVWRQSPEHKPAGQNKPTEPDCRKLLKTLGEKWNLNTSKLN